VVAIPWDERGEHMSLEGTIAVVTGGGAAIGRSIVLRDANGARSGLGAADGPQRLEIRSRRWT
jgi:hypothetical protein